MRADMVQDAFERIVGALSNDELDDGDIAISALLLATAGIIGLRCEEERVDLVESFSSALANLVGPERSLQ